MLVSCTYYFLRSSWLGNDCLLIGVAFSCIAMMINLIVAHNGKAILAFLLYLGTIVMALSLVVICGNTMPVRSMTTLPLLNGFFFFIGVEVFCKKKALYSLLAVLSLYIGYRQILYLNRIFTGSHLCAELDMEMGYKIGTDIQAAANSVSPSQPVVFVGRYQHPAENIYRIDASGQSIFYRNNTIYKNFFLRYLGFSFTHAGDQVIKEAEERAKRMTAYPLDGYIEVYDDMIIVKLSGAQVFISHEIDESKEREIDALDIIPAQSASQCDVGWIGYHGIYFSCDGIRPDEENEIAINTGEYVAVSGWACDFVSLQPLSALYILIGDTLISCEYGLERADVADYFSVDSLRFVGFSTMIPAELLESDGDTDMAFLMVTADGAALYEPVVYELVY